MKFPTQERIVNELIFKIVDIANGKSELFSTIKCYTEVFYYRYTIFLIIRDENFD